MEEMESYKGIEDMPDEILINIFSYLNLKDLILSVRPVSNRWSAVSQDSELWSQLRYCPESKTSEREMIDIIKVSPKLQTFVPKNYMKSSVLEAVIENCKDIRRLELYMDQLSYDVVKKLIEECKNIEYLSIVEIDCDRKKCYQLISKCLKLKELKLTGNVPEHKCDVFKAIANGCPSLQYVDLRNLYDYTNKDLQYLIDKKKHQLLKLYLRWNSECDKCTIPIVEACEKLETLHVEEYSDIMIERGFKSLQRLPNLKCLFLPYFRSANVNYMVDLFENGKLSHLVELDLSVYDNFEDKLAYTIFKTCQKLKRLTLVYCPQLTDEGLETIHSLPDLEYLNLCSCIKITDVGIQYIGKCINMKTLKLNSCSITAQSMGTIFRLRKLQFLDLKATFNMDPFSICQIPKYLKYLKFLGISYIHDNSVIDNLKCLMPGITVDVLREQEDWQFKKNWL